MSDKNRTLPRIFKTGRSTGWAVTGLLFFMAACQQTGEQTFLPDEKVARIMADFYIGEAATYGMSGYAKDSLAQAYYDQVFQIHGVTREQYEKNLRILVRDIPRTEAILDQVDKLLGEKKDKKE